MYVEEYVHVRSHFDACIRPKPYHYHSIDTGRYQWVTVSLGRPQGHRRFTTLEPHQRHSPVEGVRSCSSEETLPHPDDQIPLMTQDNAGAIERAAGRAM